MAPLASAEGRKDHPMKRKTAEVDEENIMNTRNDAFFCQKILLRKLDKNHCRI